MAIFVHGPRCASAVPDLHLPVIVVGRNCEHIRECGRDHRAEEGSNQKYAHHFSIPHNSLYYSLLPWRVWWILRSHSRAKRCSLFWIDAFPHTSLICPS